MNVLAVIPARYSSTRFPGKPLTSIAGKPMIERVWERARSASLVSKVVVATDDERIANAVKSFGAEAVMTRADHRSGTERVAEVAIAHPEAEIVINVQGDMPLIEPAAIDAAIEAVSADEEVRVGTLAVPITSPTDIMDPNVVKTVLDFDGNALYFSRAPIPWVRDRQDSVHANFLKHLGLYVFRREALLEFATFPQGDLERIEQLEQLRWLENGYRIRVAETEYKTVEVDTPEDVKRVEQLLAGAAGAR
ncbi:MAG TPA: 3-deoxy-manno-octulosonate cytidylyltransferase [Candidatus Acidoferrales bacterium]|jgi:3-deoxy-manno-octulosonate cytidylyltransferase (CMP-KDO synthetase)|nr:3-deoxy-manno-octulosonate cytidylyltransferase [Candidatus Acidoferrales bacterium]